MIESPAHLEDTNQGHGCLTWRWELVCKEDLKWLCMKDPQGSEITNVKSFFEFDSCGGMCQFCWGQLIYQFMARFRIERN
jgi:hypothetical protein